jgi:hypothetical protein
MPTLAELVNAIPVASRGDVITAEVHNSLRSALAAIATQLGASTSTQTVTPTFAPAFLAAGTTPAWILGAGFVRNPTTGTQASGWLPLQLPHGARIQRLIVQAGRNGAIEAPAQMDVTLERQPLRGGNTTATILAQASLIGSANARNPFEVSAPFAPVGLTGGNFSEAQVVNNDDYKYFARAEMLLESTGPQVFLYGVRVECQIG